MNSVEKSVEIANITLVGDSIFDNSVYVARDESVIDQLRKILPQGARATLLAKDGAVIDDLGFQLPKMSEASTHLFISCGGNDVLRLVGLLSQPVDRIATALERIHEEMMYFEGRSARWSLWLPRYRKGLPCVPRGYGC